MAEIQIDPAKLVKSCGKVAVVLGGASGIGRATVSQLFKHGAHVYFADLDEKSGSTLASDLSTGHNPKNGSVEFHPLDVRDYQGQVRLFRTAFDKHTRVDMAIFCAGISERSGFLDRKLLTLENIDRVPEFIYPVLETNLVACMHFTRIALVYLAQNATPGDSGLKSITLVSSVAGFKESPGLVSYSASKAGIIGFMRSLRLLTVAQFGIRVNVILPWATDTPMISEAVHLFKENKIPLNTADDVAGIIQHLSGDVDAHGYSVYCAGGVFVNIEEGLDRTEPQWLGERHARDLNIGQETLGEGVDWNQEHQ